MTTLRLLLMVSLAFALFACSSDRGPDPMASATVLSKGVDMTYLDIKPGSCPNAFNPKSHGKTPAAILGTDDFDVMEIDLSTLLMENVAPLKWSYEDVGHPYMDGEPCGCTMYDDLDGPDGYMDLTLKFETQELAEALGDWMKDDAVEVTLTGILLDGTPFSATDCLLYVQSTPMDMKLLR